MNGKMAAVAAVIIMVAAGAGYYFFVLNGKTSMDDDDYKGSLVESYDLSVDANNAYAEGADPNSSEFKNMISSNDYKSSVRDIISEKQSQIDALRNETNDKIRAEYQAIDAIVAESDYQKEDFYEGYDMISDLARFLDEEDRLPWLFGSDGKQLESFIALKVRFKNYYESLLPEGPEACYDRVNAVYVNNLPQEYKDLCAKYGLEYNFENQDRILGYCSNISIDRYDEYHFRNPELMPEGTSEEFYKELFPLSQEKHDEFFDAKAIAKCGHGGSYSSSEYTRDYGCYVYYHEDVETYEHSINTSLGLMSDTYANQIRQHIDRIDELQEGYSSQITDAINEIESAIAQLQKTTLNL